jgi:hypothetical protein
MPVPQKLNFLVGWASSGPIKALLRIVQHLSFNRMQALRRGINSRRTITPVARSQFQAGLAIMTYPKNSFSANNYARIFFARPATAAIQQRSR